MGTGVEVGFGVAVLVAGFWEVTFMFSVPPDGIVGSKGCEIVLLDAAVAVGWGTAIWGSEASGEIAGSTFLEGVLEPSVPFGSGVSSNE